MTRSRWSAASAACIFAVLASGAIAAGAETRRAVPLPDVVAKVSDQPISRADLLLRLSLGGTGTPSRSRCVGMLEKAVRAAALRPELAGYRIEVSASEVEDAVEKMRASFPSDGAFRRFLNDRDADLSLLRRAIEDGLLLKKIEERQIRSWVFGDDLIQEYLINTAPSWSRIGSGPPRPAEAQQRLSALAESRENRTVRFATSSRSTRWIPRPRARRGLRLGPAGTRATPSIARRSRRRSGDQFAREDFFRI
jgi:hypothetical protein